MNQMPPRKQIKTPYLWLIFLISLVVGVLLIMEVSKTDDNTFWLILMVIDFVIMTLSINTAISRTVKYKPRPRKCVVKKYNCPTSAEINKKLTVLGFNKKSSRFGHGYIKIDGETAYKVVVIDDFKKYFTSADNIATEAKEEQDKPTPGIENCTKFIGFEIFFSMDKEHQEKVLDFSFQGKNIFYDGFYLDQESNLLIEPNYIKPKDIFVNEYNKLLQMLEIIEIVEND